MQPRHAVGRGLELDPSLRARRALPFGEGLGHDVFAEVAGLATYRGRGVRRRELGEQCIELRARVTVVVTAEVAGLLDDHPRMLHRDDAAAQRRQGRREPGRQRGGFIELPLHRALGHAQRRRELGRNGAMCHLASPLRRERSCDERLGAAHRVAYGEEQHIDTERRVHRLHALCLHGRLDQL